MKTTLDLPDDLVRAVKFRALHQGKKLKETVADLLRQGLAAENSPRPARPPVIKTHPKTGAPYFQGSPDAPLRHMTAEQLIELEQELQTHEDLERVGLSPGH